MKKLFIMLCMIVMSVFAFADRQASGGCNVEEIPGAYITAHVAQLGNAKAEITVNAYVVKEGTVIVKFDYVAGSNNGTKEVYVSFSNGKGYEQVTMPTSSSMSISNVRVYNPICKTM